MRLVLICLVALATSSFRSVCTASSPPHTGGAVSCCSDDAALARLWNPLVPAAPDAVVSRNEAGEYLVREAGGARVLQPFGWYWTGARCEADFACECGSKRAEPSWKTLAECQAAHAQCAR